MRWLLFALCLLASPAWADPHEQEVLQLAQFVPMPGQTTPLQGAAPACSYPLPVGSDTVGIAYGFRKLRSAYAGKAVRLYREVPGDQTDIGFAANNCDFDAASAATFCSGTTCHIVKFYDQSGNGSDVSSCSAATCPVYTASCQNSQPCSTWAAGGASAITLASGIAGQSYSSVIKYTSLVAGGYTWYSISNGTNLPTIAEASNSTSGCFTFYNDGTTGHTAPATCSGGAFLIQGGTVNNTTTRVWVNGTVGTDATYSVTVASETGFKLGENRSAAQVPNGALSELIIFAPAVADADVQSVCHNQGTYWGITVSC